MKLFHDSAPCLIHLLLLAELFVQSASSSRHTNSHSLCGMFASMIPRVERLMNLSKKLHQLSEEELMNFYDVEHRLETLPHIPHTAEHFNSIKVNESLAQLLGFAQSFKLHVDWLIEGKENVSVFSPAAEGASTHLLQLTSLINASLHQIGEAAPPSPSPSLSLSPSLSPSASASPSSSPSPSLSLPVISTAFEELRFSIEISERLQVFCHWTKRVLRHLKNLSRCPRR